MRGPPGGPLRLTVTDFPDLLSLLFTIIAAIALLLAFRYFNRARHLAGIPRSKIRSAPQGYIEIVGKARALAPVPYYVPGLRQPCVWFECSYREGVGDDTRTVYKRTESSFLVDDGTGVCRIDPHAMKIETVAATSHRFNLQGRGARDGLLATRWIGVGDTVHAYGRFDTLGADWHGQKRDAIRQRLGALKKDRELMRQFDTDGDGAIDLDEWDRAREAVKQEVEAHFDEKRQVHDRQDALHVLRPPQDARLPYLVSNREEMRLVGRYRLYAAACLLLFVAVLVAVVEGSFVDGLEDWIDLSLRHRL